LEKCLRWLFFDSACISFNLSNALTPLHTFLNFIWLSSQLWMLQWWNV